MALLLSTSNNSRLFTLFVLSDSIRGWLKPCCLLYPQSRIFMISA